MYKMLRGISKDEKQPDASPGSSQSGDRQPRLAVAWTFAYAEKSFGSCGVFLNITKQYTCKCRLAARPGGSKQPVVQVGLRRCTGVTGNSAGNSTWRGRSLGGCARTFPNQFSCNRTNVLDCRM